MQRQVLLERLEAALTEKHAALIEQLKAELPKELPPDVFSKILSHSAFIFREDRGIFHPPLETGLGLRFGCNELGLMPEWTRKMNSFYDIWENCSPEAKTQRGRKFGGSVSRR